MPIKLGLSVKLRLPEILELNDMIFAELRLQSSFLILHLGKLGSAFNVITAAAQIYAKRDAWVRPWAWVGFAPAGLGPR